MLLYAGLVLYVVRGWNGLGLAGTLMSLGLAGTLIK
jgi:hypothetical protein